MLPCSGSPGTPAAILLSGPGLFGLSPKLSCLLMGSAPPALLGGPAPNSQSSFSLSLRPCCLPRLQSALPPALTIHPGLSRGQSAPASGKGSQHRPDLP